MSFLSLLLPALGAIGFGNFYGRNPTVGNGPQALQPPAMSEVDVIGKQLEIRLPASYPSIAGQTYAQSTAAVSTNVVQASLPVPSSVKRLLGITCYPTEESPVDGTWAIGVTVTVQINTDTLIQNMPLYLLCPAHNNYPLGYFPIGRKCETGDQVLFTCSTNAAVGQIMFTGFFQQVNKGNI